MASPRKPRALNLGNAVLLSRRKRRQSAPTARIIEIAKRFPGRNVASLKQIASFVYQGTKVIDTVRDREKRFVRSAEEVIHNGSVDLLHCYDRCHAMTSILAAKGIPGWMVLELDWRNFLHSYVETAVGNEIYTIAFRMYEPPIIAKGKVEDAISHDAGSTFLRGLDLGDLGVTSHKGYERLVALMQEGAAKDRIKIVKK